MSEEIDRLGRAATVNESFRAVEFDAEFVRRPAGPGTATVHSLLRHLREKGLSCVPEPVGADGGVETLRYLPGESGGDGWYHQHVDRGLASAARLLRLIHDAGADWVPPTDAVWGAAVVPGDDVVFCHGDPGPWNFVWRDHEAVGLIDWDYLHPAPRLDDVAYALRWFGPYRSDEMARDWHHFPEIPDRRHRAHAFLEAYGGFGDFDIADAVIRSIRFVTARMVELAEQGVEPQRTWVADGAAAAEAAEIEWIEANRGIL